MTKLSRCVCYSIIIVIVVIGIVVVIIIVIIIIIIIIIINVIIIIISLPSISSKFMYMRHTCIFIWQISDGVLRNAQAL